MSAPELRKSIEALLGEQRADGLNRLAVELDALESTVGDAWTADTILLPLSGLRAQQLEAGAAINNEDWIYIRSDDGKTILAVDEFADAAHSDYAAAVIYPELHTRLVSWWLTHAWRVLDLATCAVDAVWQWRLPSAAVASRAVLEETGSLLRESQKFGVAWAEAKKLEPDALQRPASVRRLFTDELIQAGFGTRLDGSSEKIRATNVLTLVDKLGKTLEEPRIREWYDWLSDSSHPAFGARVLYSTLPISHASRAVTVRYYSRSPMVKVGRDGNSSLHVEVVEHIADTILLCGLTAVALLTQSLAVVDDFGLTTGAARFTERRYWRNFIPVRGNRKCPCGAGSWSMCGHRWGLPAPSVLAPRAGDTLSRDPRSERP
ncbi:hypothetical protein [Cryptosporangium sp. NPDC048952]|uniref:hypothetical protein n=1 Tax=Cryptosporangium sp. NPDC048952 TaxID=3363961 RepID=UPI003712CB61